MKKKEIIFIENEGDDKLSYQFESYVKYKCKKCGCEFWRRKYDNDNTYGDYDDWSYVKCPRCKHTIYTTRFRYLKVVLAAILIAVVSVLPGALSTKAYRDKMKVMYITEEEYRAANTAICITIPKNVKWEDYKKELDAVKDGKQEMNFKVPNLPTKVKPGDRCYLCYKGQIIGWMKISNMGPKKFKSTTDGTDWEGNFISRTGQFHTINPVSCKGFRGFKYLTVYGDKIVLDDK